MRRDSMRSISTPLIMAGVSVCLSVALLVGWTLVILKNSQLTSEVVANTWLLVAGIVSLSVIMSVVVWFGVFLAIEIVEGRRQTSFIDSVTHELKSPLASLKLCLETQARPGLSAEQHRQLLDMMLSDVDRLSVFIEDILVASRLGYERRGQTVAEVELPALARRCADVVARRYHLPAGAIRVEVPDTMRLVTDITALETIVKNLLDNSAKYSDPPIDILLKARAEAGGTTIEIIDHGIGIPPKHSKKIFDRFYRAPGEAVRARPGTGLGLFVVAALVRALGGNVEAHSEGVGRGTSVKVRLPEAAARRAA